MLAVLLQGDHPDFMSYTGEEQDICLFYMIQGIPWTEVESVLRQGYAWQVSCSHAFLDVSFSHKVRVPLHKFASLLLVHHVAGVSSLLSSSETACVYLLCVPECLRVYTCVTWLSDNSGSLWPSP